MKKTTSQELRISKTHIFSILLIPSLLCCFFIYYGFINPNPQDKEDIWWILPLILLLLIGGIIYLWSALKFRIILSDESIQLKSLFSQQKIRIEDLGNYSKDESGLHIYMKKHVVSPTISISTNLEHVDLLYHWLQQYSSNPEMEAQLVAYKEVFKEFSENEQYGKNTIEKNENLLAVHKIASWLNKLSFFVLVWVGIGSLNIWSVPFIDLGVSIAILIPLITVYFSIRYKGFFNLDFDEKKIESFPLIFSPLWFPNCSLIVFWGFAGLYIFDTSEIWLYASLASLLIMLPIFYASRDFTFKKIGDYFKALFITLGMLGYGYGTVAYINLYYDNSEAKEFLVEVLKKEAGKGKNSAHHITLAPWGEYEEAQRIEVRGYIFKRTKEGEEISIYLKEGYLGIQYYGLSLEQ